MAPTPTKRPELKDDEHTLVKQHLGVEVRSADWQTKEPALRDKIKEAGENLIAQTERESRSLSADEQRALDVAGRYAGELAKFIEGGGGGRRTSPSNPGGGPRLEDEHGREIRTFGHGESPLEYLEQREGWAPETRGARLGELICGLATARWEGRDLERRAAQSSNIATAGGYLVPGQMSVPVLDRARNQTVAVRAGARTAMMDGPSMTIARLDGEPTMQPVAQGAEIPTGTASFSAATLTAHKMAIRCQVPIELAEDAPNAGATIESAIAEGFAETLDAWLLAGDGVAKPLGIASTAGVASEDLSGAAPDYDDFLQLLLLLQQGNAPEPLSFAYAPRTANVLSLLKASGSGEYLRPPVALDNAQKFVTNQIPIDLGAGSGESLVIAGSFAAGLLLGIRSELQIEISREGGEAWSKGMLEIRAIARVDGMVLRQAFFALLTAVGS